MTDATPGPDPRPPIDETLLYLTTQGTQLGVREEQYIVRDLRDRDDESSGAKALARFPVEQIETINVFGQGVDVTSGARSTADRTETPINFFTTNGRFRGRFVPSTSSVAVLHEQQHTLGAADRLDIAKQFVRGKIHNAIRHLKRKEIDLAADDDLAVASTKIDSAASLDELRGAEGVAAKSFYQHYDQTLLDGWSMDGRSRRPPDDHVNSLLSLTYTFLQRETEAALRQVNLDPYVGVFHTNRHGRPALALDLVEEFRRAFADPFVARLINQGHFVHDDFTVEHELADAAFDRYIEQYDTYMDETLSHRAVERTLTRREVIRLQAHLLRKRIVSDISEYPPFVLSQ